jgi:molybdopterin-guanine dinucleotide biosynthesis protein
MPCQIIINGPIGSGKSTLAMELGRQAHSHGHSAAVIDLDIVYDMLDHRQKSDGAVWLAAHQTAAVLTDHFCRSGLDLVVVEGTFWDLNERAAFLGALTTPISPHIVTLRVSVEQALQRVETDPTRGIKRVALSRDPAVLARNHADFAARSAAVSAGDLVIDTDTIGTAALAELLLTRYLSDA